MRLHSAQTPEGGASDKDCYMLNGSLNSRNAPYERERIPLKMTSRSIPSLDGLRGVAVTLVIIAHLGIIDRAHAFLLKRGIPLFPHIFEFDAGDLGVSVFFVISGYLITTLLLRQSEDSGSISLKNFYLRRLFRISPPYCLYLLAILALWALHIVPMRAGAFLSALTYTSNYYPYSSSHPESYGWLVGHTWSLSLEEQFYLIWPACLQYLGKRKAALLGIGTLILAPALRMPPYMYSPRLPSMDKSIACFTLASIRSWQGA
jgi:peptidoglycan/LPS O-acetylase OafA/YrhL